MSTTQTVTITINPITNINRALECIGRHMHTIKQMKIGNDGIKIEGDIRLFEDNNVTMAFETLMNQLCFEGNRVDHTKGLCTFHNDNFKTITLEYTSDMHNSFMKDFEESINSVAYGERDYYEIATEKDLPF